MPLSTPLKAADYICNAVNTQKLLFTADCRLKRKS